MVKIWRNNLVTGGDEPRKFCLENKIMGCGWPVNSANAEKLDWDTYYNLGLEQYYNQKDKGWFPAVIAIRNRVEIGDLCWMRDIVGVYYLGRVASPWRYADSSENVKADIVNVRDCEWYKIGTIDSVPGRIVTSFIGKTLQEIHDDTVKVFSQYIYNKISGKVHYQITLNPDLNIFSLFSSDDCEDALGIYLQMKQDYLVIPSTAKNDTMGYEYALINKKNGKTAVVQVKNGEENINVEAYKDIPGDVFLLTTKGTFTGQAGPNIHCINPVDLERFIMANYSIMPNRIKTRIDLMNELKHTVNKK